METRELFDRYVVPNYGRFPLALARGEGCRVWDEAGKCYLDFGAGIAVTSLGHAHPRLIEVMAEQAARLVHTSNLYYTRPQGELARRLVEVVDIPGKVFFCNSGAEANEALLKLSRKYGHESVPPPPRHTTGELSGRARHRHHVITFRGSFHGRTFAGISATGQDKVKTGFTPLLESFSHLEFNDAPAVLSAITPETVAIMVEPVLGEGGIHLAEAHFLRQLRTICDDYGLLLFFDEVQCGLGRTGDWCGWKSIAPDVVPDGVSWAKGIAGGFPLGAVWIRDHAVEMKTGEKKSLADILGPGSHGSTFGGTPLVCAGALEVLRVIEEEKLLQNARTLGAYAVQRLEMLPSPPIAEVRALGLMIGIELAEDFGSANDRAPSLQLVDRLHEAGMLSIPAGNHTIRWLPPLNVTRAEIDAAIDILARVLQKSV